jgi:hypothetical protein
LRLAGTGDDYEEGRETCRQSRRQAGGKERRQGPAEKAYRFEITGETGGKARR